MTLNTESTIALCIQDSSFERYLPEFMNTMPRVDFPEAAESTITHICWWTGQGLAIGPRDLESRHATRVDFSDPGVLHRLKTSGKRQGIGKAVGLDKAGGVVRVVDATAGLGRDALVLAHLGCQVVLLERSPLVHALLADGLRRAQDAQEPLVQAAASRMQLLHMDARDYLAGVLASDASRPDVITLDPMFPPRQKTALVKKDMHMLQQLLGFDRDLQEVLNLARQCAIRRVVVKRPPGQPDIPGPCPSFELSSKAAHFAVYVNSSFSSTP